MTKSLRDYLKESESIQDRPIAGDQFAINIREECLLETAIADVVEDGIVLEADDRFMEILESYGMLAEDSRDAVRSAISRRIMSHNMDLLSRYGIDRVMDAIDDAADRYGSGDLDEIGSSDVSAFVNSVRQSLEGTDRIDELNVKQIKKDLESGMSHDAIIGKHANKRTTNTDEIRRVIQQHAWNKRMKKEEVEQIDELSPGRVERYAHAAQRDMARHAAAAKTLRHQRGAEDWQAQEHEREADRRERGLERAQRRMNEADGPGFMGAEEGWLEEGAMKDIAIQYQDWKQMSPREFFAAYNMTKDAWMARHRDVVKTTESYELDEMRRRAGVAEGDITQLEKDIADAPVKPIASMEGSCGSMREVLDRLDGKRQQVAERMVDVDGFRFEMDYVIEELRAWFDHLDTGEDLDDTTAEHIEHALTSGRDHGRQLWAEMQDLPRRQFAQVIGQIVNHARRAASEEYAGTVARGVPDRSRDDDDEGGISVGDLREGRMKQQMHTDAERMDLEAFCDKYGDESWVKEFWHNINDLDEDQDLEGNAYEMGYRAAAMYHKSRSSNPFEGVDELKAMEWEDGWREGAAEEGLDESDDAAAARASRAKIDRPAVFRKQERFLPSRDRSWQASLQDLEQAQDLHRRERAQREKDLGLDEAEYQGRKVALGKPMQGDVKKFKVYVKDPKTGNVKKVNFGDPNMRIKKSNPARRRSFRARHNCANPGPRTKARYWSCRKW